MKFNLIKFDSGESTTELCLLGEKYKTDKSPHNDIDPYGNFDIIRHAYTPFYNTIFSPFKYKPIIFGEIGIYKNASIKCWREFFKYAKIYAWDNLIEFVEDARKANLDNVIYDYIDVNREDSIHYTLSSSGELFDIIIDDSSHVYWDQIRVIRNAAKYLKPGGILVIEDIDREWDGCENNDMYYAGICEYGHDQFFSEIVFVETEHKNKMTGPYNNDKILYLIRNEENYFT